MPRQKPAGNEEVKSYIGAGTAPEAATVELFQSKGYDNKFGAVCAIIRDPETGGLIGGADPREVAWAQGK